jgi:hypothetical protein
MPIHVIIVYTLNKNVDLQGKKIKFETSQSQFLALSDVTSPPYAATSHKRVWRSVAWKEDLTALTRAPHPYWREPGTVADPGSR